MRSVESPPSSCAIVLKKVIAIILQNKSCKGLLQFGDSKLYTHLEKRCYFALESSVQLREQWSVMMMKLIFCEELKLNATVATVFKVLDHCSMLASSVRSHDNIMQRRIQWFSKHAFV